MGVFEVRVGGEADLAAALGELWGSVEGGRVRAPQLSCLCSSWDNIRTVRGYAGNCMLWPVFLLGLRALLDGCNKPEETQLCCDLCI